MFFDVTRAGTDRRLRVAVAAIAFLDTLPIGSVLHLVGGQSLQVGETVVEIEERAIAASPVTQMPRLPGDPGTDWISPGEARSTMSVPEQPSATEADSVDWTEVLASAIAVQPTAEQPPPTPKPRRRRQEKAA